MLLGCSNLLESLSFSLRELCLCFCVFFLWLCFLLKYLLHAKDAVRCWVSCVEQTDRIPSLRQWRHRKHRPVSTGFHQMAEQESSGCPRRIRWQTPFRLWSRARTGRKAKNEEKKFFGRGTCMCRPWRKERG